MSNLARHLTFAQPLRLISMTDDSERRDTPTDLAPPPSEPQRKTQPPGAPDERAARVMQTMLPGAPPSPYQAPPTWWEGSFFQSVFNDVQASLRSNAEILEGQNAILAAVQQADRNNQSGWSTTQAQITNFRAEMVANRSEIAAMRAELEQLKASMKEQAEKVLLQAERIDKLERLLEQQEANESAGSPTPSATG